MRHSMGEVITTLLAMLCSVSFAQTLIYQTDFENPLHGWSFPGTPVGPNGAEANEWHALFGDVSRGYEDSVAPPGCATTNPSVASNTALRIVPSVGSPFGQATIYDSGGLCGVLTCPETNLRSESPVISTVGASNIVVSFDAIVGGAVPTDRAELWFSDGTTWMQVAPLTQTSSAGCAPGRLQWAAYGFALPSSANNNANVRIGFVWRNNDDGVGGDVSVAIDNVRVTGLTAPNAPTAISASAGNGLANVSFAAPASDGGSAITGYLVTSAPGGFQSVGCVVSPCVVAGLTNGTVYSFTVVAINAIGSSGVSLPSNGVTPFGAPFAPTNVSGTRVGSQASIQWSAPFDNGSPITSYQVTAQPGGQTCIASGQPPPTSCTFPSLAPNRDHTFFVVAVNAAGSSPAASIALAASALVFPVPTTTSFAAFLMVLCMAGAALFQSFRRRGRGSASDP
jgi:hypothetical protein